MGSFERKTRFKSDCNKAFKLIIDNGVIADSKLQYTMDVSNGVWYRIRRVLLDCHDLFPNIELHEGMWKDRTLQPASELDEKRVEALGLDHWAELEPDTTVAH